MDNFPPTYDFPSDADDGTVYTDIHVDPASLPPIPVPETDTLQTPFVLSDEEMEEEEEPEEESEENSGEEPLVNRTSDDDLMIPDPSDEDSSDYFPTDDDESDPGPDDHTTPALTAPPPALTVAHPSTTTYYFPPRNGGPRMVHTARKQVHLPRADYASTSRALPPPPPHSAIQYERPVETSNPTMSPLRDSTDVLSNRIRELEQRVTTLQGPEGLGALDARAHHPDRFMHAVDRQMDVMERRLAEQIRELRYREDEDRLEILNLRRRLLALDDHLSGLYRR